MIIRLNPAYFLLMSFAVASMLIGKTRRDEWLVICGFIAIMMTIVLMMIENITS